MADTIVMLHGWNDCSASFRGLASFLRERGAGEVESIYYADYESREDAISYEDVVGGLDDELRERRLVDAAGRGSFDVVVHSAGALVIRHWIWRYYADRLDDCPVENLVMLAPANFGSPLAHRGKSLLGRMLAGRWKVGDMLEVGRRLLHGLELGSRHQWELAHRDVLGPEPFYDADRVRLTVLVGLDDYAGLLGWVDDPGTDGAVVVAGTPLDSVKLGLDFSRAERPLRWERETAHGDFAFGVLPGYDHGSIVDALAGDVPPDREPVKRHVLSALSVDSASAFRRHRDRVAEARRAAYNSATYVGPDEVPKRWQQFLLRAVDDQEQPVRDFTLEFLVHRRESPSGGVRTVRRTLTARERELSLEANRLMTANFHAYSRDPSYRRTLIDVDRVTDLLPEDHVLAMRIFVPEVEEGIYYDTRRLRDVVVHDPAGGARSAGGGRGRGGTRGPVDPCFLHPNTTTLLQLRVDRVTDHVTVSSEPRRD